MSNPRSGTEILESIEKQLEKFVQLHPAASPVRKKESEDTRELYKALAAAQKGFKDIYKSGIIAGRNTPYAKISDLIDASRGSLLANSLICNTYIVTDYDRSILVTRLIHYPSGQFLESELILLNGSEEQKRGSSITYAWRYTYAPLIGLVDTSYDDDGEVTKPVNKGPYGK